MKTPRLVLHLDGDSYFKKACSVIYDLMDVTAKCFYVPETHQPKIVTPFIKKFKPDILVLTGHDCLIKPDLDLLDINNYLNSKHFAAAVKAARAIEPDHTKLIIFAGACESHFESIIAAGANYASSPYRILIHIFDPVFLAEMLVHSPMDYTLPDQDLINNTITGIQGINSNNCQ